MRAHRLAACLAGSLAALSATHVARAEEPAAAAGLTIAAPPSTPPGPIAPAVQAVAPPPVIAKPAPKPAPPPPPVQPPAKPQRWYGWQVLIVHALSDAIVVGGLVASENGHSGGVVAMALAPIARGFGSGILEAAHDDLPRAIIFGAGSFLVPLVSGVLTVAAVDEDDTTEAAMDEEFAPALGGGMLVGGAVMTAIQVATAFEDKPNNVAVNLSPTYASVTVAF